MSCGCQKPTCCCSCGDREPPKAYVGDPSCSNDTCPKTKSPTVSAYVGDPSSCDSEACRPKIKIDEPKTIVDECGNCCPLKPCPCPCPKPEPCPCPKKKKNVCDPCDEPTWPRPVCDQCKPTCGMKEKECPQKDSCMGATWPRPNYDQCKPMTCPSRDKEQCRLREAAAKAKKQQDKNSSGCKIADAECPDAIVAKPDNISVLPFLGIPIVGLGYNYQKSQWKQCNRSLAAKVALFNVFASGITAVAIKRELDKRPKDCTEKP